MFADPEMMRVAQEAMSKMSPEQIAAMQRQAAAMDPAQMQQAMSMMQGMSPEQMRAAASAAAQMSPEALTQQAGAAQAQLSAQQRYQHSASLQLKAEGNKLHAAGQYEAAAEKYQRAVANLADHAAAESAALRASCQGNLASCYLHLRRWQDCAAQCDAVLGGDPANRKALYRRGQALTALGRAEPAVLDLQRALDLSPEAEAALICEKLEEAKRAQQEQQQQEQQQQEQQQRQVASVGAALVQLDGVGPTTEGAAAAPGPAPTAAPAPATPAVHAAPETGVPGLDPRQAEIALETMRNDPGIVAKAAEAMSRMSDAELAAGLAQAEGGMPGMTPEMARAAATMMQGMSPEQLREMAEAAGAARPAPDTAGAAAAMSDVSATGLAGHGRLAAEAMRRDPGAMRSAARMMSAMGPEQLEAMSAMMPGGMKVDVAQLKMAAQMMESMSPEALEQMTELAQKMGVAPGAATPAASSTAAAAAPGAGAALEANGSAAAAPAPAPQPHAVPPDMMAAMRRQMADPATLRSMQSMLKSMDPQTLSSMMKANGMSMEPDQAAKMVEQMGSVSETHMAWLARMLAAVNLLLDAYQRARAWAMSNAALALALLVLLLALLLRWRGWL